MTDTPCPKPHAQFTVAAAYHSRLRRLERRLLEEAKQQKKLDQKY